MFFCQFKHVDQIFGCCTSQIVHNKLAVGCQFFLCVWANQGKISLTIIYSYFLSINLNNKAIWKDPSLPGKTALLEGT